MFETEFCKIDYLEKYNAVFCQWKKFCRNTNYRDPFEYGLKLINENNAIAWITDTTNGFENETDDTQWLLENFIPKAIGSSCNTIYFIITGNSPLKHEIDAQADELSKYFSVKQIEKLEHIPFLQETDIVDFSTQEIQDLAQKLSNNCKTDVEIAKKCFEYVRDYIEHSGDCKNDVSTCKASDVLKHKTGWCYAKSHLLAALLRTKNIPAGFCYQRLSCSEYRENCYSLHGLNAVYLKQYGWYRIDPRGNKKSVNAQFNPPVEQLAFEIQDNEYDLPQIYENPLDIVVEKLQSYHSYEDMVNNLPDIE